MDTERAQEVNAARYPSTAGLTADDLVRLRTELAVTQLPPTAPPSLGSQLSAGLVSAGQSLASAVDLLTRDARNNAATAAQNTASAAANLVSDAISTARGLLPNLPIVPPIVTDTLDDVRRRLADAEAKLQQDAQRGLDTARDAAADAVARLIGEAQAIHDFALDELGAAGDELAKEAKDAVQRAKDAVGTATGLLGELEGAITGFGHVVEGLPDLLFKAFDSRLEGWKW